MQSYQQNRRSSGRVRRHAIGRNAVRATAVATLCTFMTATWAADGSAAVVWADATPGFVRQAEETRPYAKRTAPKPKPAETYEERQDRVADSKRSLLARTEEQRNSDTQCVSGEFTTLGVVFESIAESTIPTLPLSMQAEARRQAAQVRRDMGRTHVSTLAVSESPLTLGADGDDPATRYRSPISQLIVSGLLKIRDGKQNEAIALENITLSQAVETGWLAFFAGVLAPTQIAIGLLPALGSPFTDTPLSPLETAVTYNTLVSLAFSVSRLGLNTLYGSTSNAILNQCVAQITDEQKAAAGRASEAVVYDIPIAPILQATADQLALADSETCTPIGDLSLGRIVTRTSEYVQSTLPGAADKRRVKAEADKILAGLRTTTLPHNLIPADPADFTQAETIASFIGGMIPLVGGAPLDIVLGLTHNVGQGDNLLEQVSLADLTVTKSLTAAYYSYYLGLHLFSTFGGTLVPPLASTTTLPVSPLRLISLAAGLPLTYGLVTYHHVVRSMCFIEDDKSGTGRGAEANKLKATESASESQTASSTSTTGNRAPSTSRPAPSSTPAARPAAPVPGLPEWLPIPR